MKRIDYQIQSLSESIHQQFFQLAKNVLETEDELRSMINIRPLMGTSIMPFDGWAIDGLFAAKLIQILEEVQPELVLECGSGTSTVLVARYLKQNKNGQIIALEHKEQFVASTSRHLCRHELDKVAEVIESPLREYSMDGHSRTWYDFDPDVYLEQNIDLLIIDGPPGNTSPLARYPAVPLLKSWLSSDGIILLDDGNREDEKEIAEKWIKELNATPEFHKEGKGIWIIRK
ncbi:class I SAM-dependent methyltransferase [Aliifodinibius sp. S!AR15-10]|uniref:class I SAM-dependent methyltransferase n=1 Tax=Aliifodinibius sp. S!AR15-10 TaxID=2950437 RepID=UPI0028557EC2|nr:class I SAM-dependent methyltransferase [Aliifodinibius sp. S!AR15-10]MDR8394653.1 class I SAM-dependent methyltransferase [Aliifodinibius sp. S!AR15-10]